MVVFLGLRPSAVIVALGLAAMVGLVLGLPLGLAVESSEPEAGFEPTAKTDRWLDDLGEPDAGVTFVENEGQADDDVDYAVLTDDYDAVVVDGDVVLVTEGTDAAEALAMEVVGGAEEPASELLAVSPIEPPDDGLVEAAPVVGAQASTAEQPSGAAPQATPDATDEAVEFDEVLPGIDVIYSANGDDLEYSFIIEPGADPAAISLEFDNATELWITDSGDLVIEATMGPDLLSTAPITFQERKGKRVLVESAYQLRADGTVGFTLGPYDPSLPVIIDPTFVTMATASGSYTSGSTIDLPVPSTVATDDLMIAHVAYNVAGTTGDLTPPAGWNTVNESAANGLVHGVYWRIATSSEPTQYSFTLSGGSTETAAGAITLYDGVDTTSPIDATATQTNGPGAGVTAPSVTSTVANATLVAFWSVEDDGTLTPPGGMTERVDVVSDTGDSADEETIAAAADEVLGAAGATGSRTATVDATDGSIGTLVALTPAPTGGGATSLVMVTGNGAFSGGTDAAKQSLFQGWGWTVTAIDDDSSASAFTSAAAANDVMFVSDTSKTAIAYDLRDLDVGIVSEHFSAWNGLLYYGSQPQNWSNDTTIDIVDNSHYITSPFSTGSLTVHSSADDVNYWPDGTDALPAGVTVLADSPTSTTDVALHVAETGTTLYSATTAVNRRVWFPSEQSNPANWTTDYETLLERSLDWAAGNDTASVSASPTVTVNSTGDAIDNNIGDDLCDTGGTNADGDPECTLRAAIAEANASTLVDTIRFLIPTGDGGHASGVWTIAPGSALPTISTSVDVDATTQAGYATPVVAIDGTGQGSGDGLLVSGDDVTIRGLNIHSAPDDGIEVTGARATIADNHIGTNAAGTAADGNVDEGVQINGADAVVSGNVIAASGQNGLTIAVNGHRARVVGNHIGTDVTGNVDLGNGQEGIELSGADDVIIGEPGNGNVISGNAYAGINGWDLTPSRATVQANRIGVGADGTTSLPNGTTDPEGGITVRTTGADWLIGGTGAGEGNIIANNVGDGVQLVNVNGAADDIAVLGNSIYANTGLGIDINNDGITANDAGDADVGINDLLNFPVITDLSESAGTVTADYDLDAPAGNYRIEFFSNPSGTDSSGNGEGEAFVHAHSITHTGSGSESFSTTFSGASTDVISLTTTEDLGGGSYGSTSEFAAWVAASSLTVTVNSSGDASDASAGDGLCDTGGTNANSDPECTLRAAIEEANASAVVDTIEFAIPTGDSGYTASPLAYTLTPTSGYPLLTTTMVIDATTQPGWTGDPIVQLDGTSAVGATAGLAIRADDSTIAGLIVHSFPDEGLEIDGTTGFGDNNTLRNNWVGLDASGAVVGNTDHGILVTVDATGNLIGGTGANDGNRVAGSGGDGINVRTSSFDNALVGNEVWANTGTGIDLDDDGVTANDPGDGDAGSNDRLNTPVIGAAWESGGTVNVTFELDVPANPDQYRVEFFSNPSGADPSGSGEGQSLVSTLTTPPGPGLTHSFSGSLGDIITATVTEIDSGAATGFGPTSEFSNAFIVTASEVTTASFQQGAAGYSGTVDTWISSNVPTQDNSALPAIELDASPVQDGLIRFDDIIGVSAGQIPTGVTVLSADLVVEGGDPSTADATVSLYRMLAGWAETDTWNSLGSGVSTNDVEASSATDTTHTGGLDVIDTPIVIDGLAAAVQAWVDGASNQGWFLTLDRTDGWDVRSSETTTASQRPRLEVTYATGPITLAVNSTADDSDQTAGDGICDTGGTNSQGSPRCTLRAAIEEANASTAVDGIHFAMPTSESGHAGGVWTIAPASGYPSLADSVTIDGSTQAGWTSTPVVELDGTSAGASTDGLRIVADDVTIRSLAINRFGGDGIELASGAANTTIAGNHLGLDASGLVDRGNGVWGIELASGSGPTTVGGTTAVDRNVISANTSGGITIFASDDNVIIGNYLGTDVTGNASGSGIGNGGDGIWLGSTSAGNTVGQPGSGNVLSGNSNDGFENTATGANNTVQANTIGLGADGTTVLGNTRHGVVIYNGANNTQVGGNGAGEGNVISSNGDTGVVIDGNSNPATTSNTVAGNLIGTDATGLLDRGNLNHGVELFGGATGNTIGGSTAAHGNVISGNGSGEAGITIVDAASSGNVVQFNSIGVDEPGTSAIPNNLHGIRIESPNTQVLDNVIAGNDVHGVYVFGTDATGTQILRNSIGTNAAETAVIANGFDGVRLEGSSGATVIGTAGNGNVIAGSGQHGITINDSDGNTIQGNHIGTNAGGSVDLGNTDAGVYVPAFNSSNNLIGGSVTGEGNTIAFNDEGVRLESGTGNAVLGNDIHANTELGIDLVGGSENAAGVTSNDGGDGDSGPNDLLNVPVVTSTDEMGGTVTVDFDLDVPAGDYRVEFFTNSSGADPSGSGEGEAFVHGEPITHTGTGSESFSAAFAGSAGDVIATTATEDLGGGSYGSTSEFSGVATVSIGASIVQAVADSETSDENQAFRFDPGANDSDADLDSFDEIDVTTPANGTAAINGDGTVTYTSDSGYTGADAFDYWTIDAGASLSHYWGLAGDGVDAVGSADGTLVGTTTVTGDFGDALSFDEVDDHVAVPDFAYGSDLTLSFEFKLDDNSGSLFQYVYSHGDINAVNSINVFFVEGSHGTDPDVLRTVARDGDDTLDNTALEVDIASLVGDGLWHTYTLTASDTGGLTVWLDGVSVATDATRGTGSTDPSGTAYFGARQDLDADRRYGGGLDTVQIYDRALSSNEIADLAAEANVATVSMTVTPCVGDSDSDGLLDCHEDANTDADSDPTTNPGPDTDGDTTPNYLDADDDGDGTPTASENADPDGDGDPRDALDTDHDGQPDYLDTEAGPSRVPIVDEQKISSTAGGLTGPLGDSDAIGSGIASVGDLDRDGVADLAVGVDLDDDGGNSRGAVYVLFLNADGTVKSEQKISDTAGGLSTSLDDGDNFGVSVAGIGDLDGDGRGELAVGALSDDDGGADRGAVYVLFLNGDGTVRAEQKVSSTVGGLTGPLDDTDHFGMDVTGLGDVDGDGIGDMAVGARWDDDGGGNRGAVYVLFLNADGTVRAEQKISSTVGGFTGPLDDGDWFGEGVAGLGDVDGDGVVDLGVGVYSDDDGGTDRGAVYVLFLNADGTVKAEQKISSTAGGLTGPLGDGDRFGVSVAGLGDIDGDGRPDLMVGAMLDDDGGSDRGSAYLLSLSATGTVVREAKISSTAGSMTGPLSDGDWFGRSVTGLGDLDGDGGLNVAVSAINDDDGGNDRGAVHIFDLFPVTSTAAVNSTADAGDNNPGDDVCWTGSDNADGDPECTLRAAITEANASTLVDTISFAIPATDSGHSGGIWTIAPASAVPTVTAATTIDASTQPGWTSAPIIVVDGSSAGSGAGFQLAGTGSTVRSFAIVGFPGDGITLAGTGGHTVAGNHIGLLADGTTLSGNGLDGVLVSSGSDGNTIGGPLAADRNVIAGSGTDGIDIFGADTVVENNYIGTDATGLLARPNADDGIDLDPGDRTRIDGNVISGNVDNGIVVDATADVVIVANLIGLASDGMTALGNGGDGIWLISTATGGTIGGVGGGVANAIATNGEDGIDVDATGSNSVIGNSIHSNGSLGLDLGTSGVTANDAGDVDTGANGLLNHPVVTNVNESGGSLTVDFDLDVPAGNYRIEFFTNASGPDPSGYGEGQSFVHGESIVHTGSGAESFSAIFTGTVTDVITTTTTEDLGGGNSGSTSEFSLASVPALTIDINSTGDGGDNSPGDGSCDTGGTNAVGADECTLRAAIEEANASAATFVASFDLPVLDPNHSAGIWTITPATVLPTITGGLSLDAQTQSGWAASPGTPVVELDAGAVAGASSDGLRIDSGSAAVTVRGLAILDAPDNLIDVRGGSGHVVAGNHIGSDAAGTTATNNGLGAMVWVGGGSIITVGGTSTADRNLIVDGPNGVVVNGAGTDGVTISGNYIGTDVTGNAALGTITFDGIRVENGATNVVVGGSVAGAGNVLGGMAFEGIQIDGEATDGVVVEGNLVGIGADGISALTIGGDGVYVVDGPDGVSVIDNIIGNSAYVGIEFDGDSVGGTVQGNRIGLDGSGNPHPNQQSGILIDDAFGNATGLLIGGTGAGEGNIISNSGAGGTWLSGIVQDSTGTNSFLANSISDNAGVGIDLYAGSAGVTANDAGDGDAGPNGLLNFPVVTEVTESGGTLTVDYSLDVPAGNYRVEFFANTVADDSGHGEGETFAHAASITHTGSGSEAFFTSFAGTVADVIAATATEDLGGGSYGGTSEFSGSASVAATVNSTGDATDASPGDHVCSTGATNADGDPECTLRAAIAEANASSIVDEIEFAIPVTDGNYVAGSPSYWVISPTSTELGAIQVDRLDATTQPGWTDQPLIQLDGGLGSAGDDGVFADQDGMEVRGLSITNWPDDGAHTGRNSVTFAANWLGVDPTGAAAANGSTDIIIYGGATGVTIGGSTAADGNVLSGGGADDAIMLDGGLTSTDIANNRIGIGADGTTNVGPGTEGIIVNDASGTTITDNRFGNMTNAAIVQRPPSTGTVITGNIFGLDDLNAAAPVGQALWTDGTGTVTFGGTGVGDGNTVRNATWDAIQVVTGATGDVTVLGNSMVANGGLGIDLSDDGVTANDAGDGDSGPNDLLNFPVVTAATVAGATVTVDFELDVPAGDYRVEFFVNPAGADASGHGEGETVVHSTVRTHTGSGAEAFSTTFAGSLGQVVTTTATEDLGGGSYGATSEFSAAATVSVPDLLVNSTGDGGDATPGDGICHTGGLNSESDPECTLRAVIEEVNALGGGGTDIGFAIPTSDSGYSTGPTAFTLTPATPYPVIAAGVSIDGSTQAEYTTLPVIVLDGSSAGGGADAFQLGAGSDGSTVNALTIHSFDQMALDIRDSDNHVVTGNVIGLQADGATAAGNRYGIYTDTAVGVTIGGTTAAERNVISANDWGLALYNDSTDAVITGNYVGTDSTGLLDRGNQFDGIFVVNSSSRAQIGGATVAEANVVAGNDGDGIYVGSGSMVDPVVQGNLIGVGADGTTPLGNGDAGINLSFGLRAQVVDNTIGPGQWGIVLANHDDAVITGNFIGTDATETEVWSFTDAAIELGAGVDDATIGGTTAAEANVVRRGAAGGIVATATSGSGNTIIGNSIVANTGPGIDLGDDGVTANDAGDVDTGPNDLLNRPAISRSVETTPGSLTTTIELDVPAGTYRIEFFRAQASGGLDDSGAGEGEELLGTGTAVHTGSGSEGFSLVHPGAAGDLISATATVDLGGGDHGSTSEFSRARPALSTAQVAVNDTGDAGDATPGDGVCDTGGLNAEGEAACTLRAAIEEINGAGGVDTIRFDLPTTDANHSAGIWTISPGSALATIGQSLTIDASTQPGWTTTPVVELDGTSAGSAVNGLEIGAPSTTIRGLAIGNFDRSGIEVTVASTSGTVIAGNHIGTDASGLVDRGNGFFGIGIDGDGTTVGGPSSADRNVISGNDDVGVTITSDSNLVLNNLIGTDATGLVALANDDDGIRLSGSAASNTIGQVGAANVLAGNTSDGLESSSTGAGNTVVANMIGVGVDGDTIVANGRHGIMLYQANNTTIGGAGVGEGNIISGNNDWGVRIDDGNGGVTTANQVVANLIGLDATATLDRGNGQGGVSVDRGATATVIGGTTTAHGNIISGNDSAAAAAVEVTDAATSGTVIRHNRIGTNGAGTAAVANAGAGVLIDEASGSDVFDNLVSGNADDGVRITGAGATGTELYRNNIGLDQVGTATLANGGAGLQVDGGASGTLVGAAGNGNVIAGNGAAGIELAGAGATTIQANYIGTDTGPSLDLGNTGAGIELGTSASTGIAIGGTATGEENVIAHNATGVAIGDAAGSGHALLGNRIYANDAIGIDLGPAGVTANDAGDGDSGANDLLNFPVIGTVQRVAGDLIVDLTLDAPAGDYRIELFGNSTVDPSGHGEGESPLGAATVTHTGAGSESFQLTVTSAATVLAATTTEDLGGGSYGSTSEFSTGVPSPDLVIVNSTGDAPDAATGDGQCDTGSTNSAAAPECTLRAAIAEANDATTPIDTIWFSMPPTEAGHAAGVWTIAPGSALPALTDTTSVDGSGQTGWTATTQAAPAGLDGTQVVVIDGAGAGASSGLVLDGDNSAVRGLVIGGFANHGIEANGDGISLTGLYLGTDAAGIAANANGGDGVRVAGASVVIGGPSPADRVLASGNGDDGISLAGSLASGATVQGAIVGFDATAGVALANAATGINVDDATGVLIGGDGAGEGNVISGNASDGVTVSGVGAAATVLGNSMVGNGGLAIDLGADDVTANDPGDGDSGPNDLLNTPALASASVDAGLLSVEYTLDVPAGTYRIEFFANPAGADPSGSGEAQTLLGTDLLLHPGGGAVLGSATVPGTIGSVVTATATVDLGGGAFGVTSEVSNATTAADAAALRVLDQSVRRSDASAAGGLDPSVAASAGTFGAGLDFDGLDDRLIGPGVDLTSGTLTVGAWVRADTLTGVDRVVSKRTGGGAAIYELSVDGGTGEAVVELGVAGGVTARGGSIATGSWHQLLATWDGADVVLYVDGAEVDRQAAVGTLTVDVDTPLVIGNTDGADAGFDGIIEHILVTGQSQAADRVSIDRTAAIDGSSLISVGGEQTGVAGPWTVSGTQTRSGSFALQAPDTPVGAGTAWAVATGIDEVGTAFRSWWWLSTDTGIDLAAGTRAGAVATDQFEAALTSASGWELRRRSGPSETVDAAAAGTPSTGTWVEVEIQTDQNGDTRLLIDGVEVQGWTAQGGVPPSGSVGLRTGLLPGGQQWYIDDAQARKLVTPEPITTLGPLDRQ